jgi:hypothetical protein
MTMTRLQRRLSLIAMAICILMTIAQPAVAGYRFP